VEISSRDTFDSLDALKDGDLDLALCMDAPAAERDLEFRALFSEDIRVVVAAGHRWVGQKSVAPADLVKEPLLGYTATSYLTQLIRTHIEREGVRMPRPVVELGSLDAIREMVKLSMGVAIMPAWVAAADVAAGHIVVLPLAGKKTRAPLGHCPSKRPPPESWRGDIHQSLHQRRERTHFRQI
jgi:DNA-binding transcriptional LysR family regulator